MKLYKFCIATFCLLFGLFHASAQTSSVPNLLTNTPQWYNQIYTWGTSLNTNYSWSNIDLEISTGYKQVTGANAASDLTLQYDFQNRWNIGLSAQFSGVGSPINAGEVQGGYALISDYDLKLDGDLRIGYDGVVKKAEIEPALFLYKLMTINSYARGGLSLPVFVTGKFNTSPTVFTEVGFGHLRTVTVVNGQSVASRDKEWHWFGRGYKSL